MKELFNKWWKKQTPENQMVFIITALVTGCGLLFYKTVYNVNDISVILSVNPETVRRWIRDGKLKATQDSRKEGNVIFKKDLRAFLKSKPKYGMRSGTII